MYFKTVVAAAITALFAGQALGAVAAAQIATDPVSACNCPNNCDYKAGTGCRYYSGPSDKSKVLSGHCAKRDNQLKCIP